MARRDFGSTRQLPSKRWQIRYKANGETQTGDATYPTQKAALAALRRIETDVERNDYFDESKGNKAFREFADEYIRDMAPGKAKGTVDNWRSQLNRLLLPTFGAMRMRDIRDRHVDVWWQSHAPSQNRRNAYFTMQRMMRYAVRWEIIRQNPCDIEGAGKDESKTRPTFTVTDFKRVLELARA